ncbi:hypothetical protein [Silvibacterium acidisoli]|uniref:hypothetical protein n=1 Tax=Acidobacteriaceae bacterium ZG23-2 TaxID=2883246 RepID=UPI00406D4F40
MKHLKTLTLLGWIAMCCAKTYAQVPSVTVDPSRHGNLAAAQDNLVQAFERISEAQRDNNSHLGGHAQRAKELLFQASQEIGLAADQADANEGAQAAPPPVQQSASAPPSQPAPPQQPANISGTWTIYAYNVSQPGSSLKQVEISQDGNILSGKFRGPHQRGHLQGWISGNHVEFSTDTRDVLTFRGEITSDGMSGMYGVHGQHAPWRAQRN